MSTATTPETREADELFDRALKLPPEARERLGQKILDSVDPPAEDPEEARRAFRAELQRRADAVANGTMKTYGREETMAYLRQKLAEGDGS